MEAYACLQPQELHHCASSHPGGAHGAKDSDSGAVGAKPEAGNVMGAPPPPGRSDPHYDQVTFPSSYLTS